MMVYAVKGSWITRLFNTVPLIFSAEKTVRVFAN